jgi:hypothetical protein
MTLLMCLQDEVLTTQFLSTAEPGGSLTISTAYLNLAASYERALASNPEVTHSAHPPHPHQQAFAEQLPSPLEDRCELFMRYAGSR